MGDLSGDGDLGVITLELRGDDSQVVISRPDDM